MDTEQSPCGQGGWHYWSRSICSPGFFPFLSIHENATADENFLYEEKHSLFPKGPGSGVNPAIGKTRIHLEMIRGMDDQRQSHDQPWLLSEEGQKSQSNMGLETGLVNTSHFLPATFPSSRTLPCLLSLRENHMTDAPAISNWTRSRHLAHLEPIRLSSIFLELGHWESGVVSFLWVLDPYDPVAGSCEARSSLRSRVNKESWIRSRRWSRCSETKKTKRRGWGRVAA